MGSQQGRIGLALTLGFVLGSPGCCSGIATEKKENRYFDNRITFYFRLILCSIKFNIFKEITSKAEFRVRCGARWARWGLRRLQPTPRGSQAPCRIGQWRTLCHIEGEAIVSVKSTVYLYHFRTKDLCSSQHWGRAHPSRDGVLCLRDGALCSASVWRIHNIKHNTPPLYGVSTTAVRIGSLACHCQFQVHQDLHRHSSA